LEVVVLEKLDQVANAAVPAPRPQDEQRGEQLGARSSSDGPRIDLERHVHDPPLEAGADARRQRCPHL